MLAGDEINSGSTNISTAMEGVSKLQHISNKYLRPQHVVKDVVDK